MQGNSAIKSNYIGNRKAYFHCVGLNLDKATRAVSQKYNISCFFLIANLRYSPQKCRAINIRIYIIYSQRWTCSPLRITGCSFQTFLSCSHHIPTYLYWWLAIRFLCVPFFFASYTMFNHHFAWLSTDIYRWNPHFVSQGNHSKHLYDSRELAYYWWMNREPSRGEGSTMLPLVKAKIADKLIIMHMILW